MVKCLPSWTRYHMESRLLLVAILAVILVFSVYAAEYSHAYALKKATNLPQKPAHKVLYLQANITQTVNQSAVTHRNYDIVLGFPVLKNSIA